MLSLILDSSTPILYVGLVKDDRVLDERYLEGKNDHAKNIVSTIEEILNKNKLEVNDLDKVICGEGPGSYTGVRMSVTVAKMISSFTKVLLYKVSSLYLMSSFYDGKVISILDARRGNGFCQAINDDKLEEAILMNKDEFINSHQDYFLVTEANIKVNPFKVIKMSTLVDNPFIFSPNYLQATEAERNLHHD